jgi:hypothetical protein
VADELSEVLTLNQQWLHVELTLAQFRTNESPAVISLYRALEEAGRLAGRGRGEVLNYETADY